MAFWHNEEAFRDKHVKLHFVKFFENDSRMIE